jgi:hypothetical protein
MAFVLLAVLLIAGSAQGEQGKAVEVDSIEDSELPKMVEVTESVKVRLASESGSAGLVGLPKGAKVEVTGRDGNMLEIVFIKSAGEIDIAKTTALKQVAEIRSAKESEEKDRALRAKIDASWQKRLKEMEEKKKRDIAVLSWRWRESAGGQYYEAVGEVLNESGSLLERVQVELATRDSSGRVIDTGTAMLRDYDLQPGERTTFQVAARKLGGEVTADIAFRKLLSSQRYTHREK